MSKPYRKGEIWYVKLNDGYEMEFTTYNEAWEYYREHLNDK